jgi:hypothetical protein
MRLLERLRKHDDRSAAGAVDRDHCATCGASVLTTSAFLAAAREVGFDVNPATGDATYTLSGVFGGPDDMATTQAEHQRRFEQVEERRGYVCQRCGRSHCTSCLMRTPQHPVTGGPRCPSCGEGPHGMLE